MADKATEPHAKNWNTLQGQQEGFKSKKAEVALYLVDQGKDAQGMTEQSFY